MKTQPIYLEDSYKTEIDATIIEVKDEQMDNKWQVILDQTTFYPMGGGQPTDQGTMIAENWQGDVNMVMVRDGEIIHYVVSETKPEIGLKVKAAIDWDRRFKNMKIHSAGHMVDFAMYVLGYSPNTLKPFKGDHGKKPYIIYQGTLDKDIKEVLEQKANELVEKGLNITSQFKLLEELEKEAIYLQPGLPTNKPLRMITLEGIGSVADGGTQVKNSSEVGKIAITDVEVKDGNTIINYKVE